MKICCRCKVQKNENEFGKNKSKKDGLHYACFECRRLYTKENYLSNKEAYSKRSKIENKKRRIEQRILIDSFKEAPCVDCKQTFPPYVMDFDHVEDNKYTNVSSMLGHSKEKVLEEIAKCELVCANCHRIRTYNRAHPR
jgi:hypothetical protein